MEQDHICIVALDFEATCDNSKDPFPQEIIEFPMIASLFNTEENIGTFHEYVCPVFNPKLSDFCKELTGCDQKTIDKAHGFTVVFDRANNFLEQLNCKMPRIIFVTYGKWDLTSMLQKQCHYSNIDDLVNFDGAELINLKNIFETHYTPGNNKLKLEEAMKLVGLEFEGRPHCGFDDTKNILKLFFKVCELNDVSIGDGFLSTPKEKEWFPISRVDPKVFPKKFYPRNKRELDSEEDAEYKPVSEFIRFSVPFLQTFTKFVYYSKEFLKTRAFEELRKNYEKKCYERPVVKRIKTDSSLKTEFSCALIKVLSQWIVQDLDELQQLRETLACRIVDQDKYTLYKTLIDEIITHRRSHLGLSIDVDIMTIPIYQ